MLIILAGITLNAVIGENGIIFQAKDTKNLVDNETRYDNQQLASLQNELKDNQLYSGIGIIPGTDQGGASEGGENGTIGGNTSTEEPNIGKDAIPPTISVLRGRPLGEGIYQSDITVQIGNEDKTQRIKYILTSNVEEMNKELYPSGLVRELDIENGGTLTFTKDGEYTIIAYSYDTKGNKSQPATLRFKRIVTELGVPNPPSFRASGTMGEKDYYSSDITVRVEAEVSIVTEKITYVVTGQAKTAGRIGEKEVTAGQNIPAEEVEIGNEETFTITADGRWTIKGYVYDKTGMKSELATGIMIIKDTIGPVITSFKQTVQNETDFTMEVVASDALSGLATSNAYTFFLNGYEQLPQSETMYQYVGLENNTTYVVDVLVKDKAGNETKYSINNNGGNGKSVETKMKTYLLKDIAKIGDYVDYFAGIWLATTNTKSQHGSIGGSVSGADIGSGLGNSDCGWYFVGSNENEIYLASAGNPLLMYVSDETTPEYVIPRSTRTDIEVCYFDHHPSRISSGTWMLEYGNTGTIASSWEELGSNQDYYFFSYKKGAIGEATIQGPLERSGGGYVQKGGKWTRDTAIEKSTFKLNSYAFLLDNNRYYFRSTIYGTSGAADDSAGVLAGYGKLSTRTGIDYAGGTKRYYAYV